MFITCLHYINKISRQNFEQTITITNNGYFVIITENHVATDNSTRVFKVELMLLETTKESKQKDQGYTSEKRGKPLLK